MFVILKLYMLQIMLFSQKHEMIDCYEPVDVDDFFAFFLQYYQCTIPINFIAC
jgi:hypothetical protein